MVKLYGLIQRRSDLTLAQFSRHWRTVHRELALRLVPPGIMRGYVQNHRRELAIGASLPPADGCPEVWLDDIESLALLAASPEYLNGAGPDESNFMEGASANCIGEPRAACGVPRLDAGSWKVLVFYSDAGVADSAWSRETPWCMPRATPLRLERDQCVSGLPDALPYTAIEATWWRDAAEFVSAWRSASGARGAIAPAGVLPIEELVVFLPGDKPAT